jgi:peptidoglycan/LPS O-acetylase OafA/YrhL
MINFVAQNIDSSGFRPSPILSVITIAFYLIFLLLIYNPGKIRFFKTPALVWVGGISYEFYLLHEALGVSALSRITQAGEFANNIQIQLVLVLLVVATSIFLSYMLKLGAIKILKLMKDFSLTQL